MTREEYAVRQLLEKLGEALKDCDDRLNRLVYYEVGEEFQRKLKAYRRLSPRQQELARKEMRSMWHFQVLKSM